MKLGIDRTWHMSFLTRHDRTTEFSGQVLPDSSTLKHPFISLIGFNPTSKVQRTVPPCPPPVPLVLIHRCTICMVWDAFALNRPLNLRSRIGSVVGRFKLAVLRGQQILLALFLIQNFMNINQRILLFS